MGVQGVRHGLHARARDRHLHGLARGRVRCLLQLRSARPPKGTRVSVSRESLAGGREQRVLEIIETARAKPARFRDERITLAHGAGGRATQTLIEGLLVPAFAGDGSGALPALADAGAVTVGGVSLAMTSD